MECKVCRKSVRETSNKLRNRKVTLETKSVRRNMTVHEGALISIFYVHADDIVVFMEGNLLTNRRIN